MSRGAQDLFDDFRPGPFETLDRPALYSHVFFLTLGAVFLWFVWKTPPRPIESLTIDQLPKRVSRLLLNQSDLATFADSTQRLTAFVREHPVAHVFGTHIEQKRTPYLDYGRGTVYQPEESELTLSRAHVFELNAAFAGMNGTLTTFAAPEFTVVPRGVATASPTPPK